MTNKAWHELADAVLLLEQELRATAMWQAEAPTFEQLNSQAPFCVDTLSFDQWLQWIFIPRMVEIIEEGEGMPGACNIRPMGEEAFSHLGRRQYRLIEILGKIDQLTANLT